LADVSICFQAQLKRAKMLMGGPSGRSHGADLMIVFERASVGDHAIGPRGADAPFRSEWMNVGPQQV